MGRTFVFFYAIPSSFEFVAFEFLEMVGGGFSHKKANFCLLGEKMVQFQRANLPSTIPPRALTDGAISGAQTSRQGQGTLPGSTFSCGEQEEEEGCQQCPASGWETLLPPL